MKNKLTVLLLLFSSICFSQFGNTWIDYSAPHYTFKITQDGIYRLPYETLANTFPISAVNSADLKIYGKQKQIPIYVRLGNGVYLYTVQAQINVEDIEHRESNADTHFKKNFGKMYLMR